MKAFIKSYRFFLAMVIVFFFVLIFQYKHGVRTAGTLGFSLKEMLSVLPPIFILLGLMDVWIPREIMIKYSGEGSGIKGVLLSFFPGAATAGHLYAAAQSL